MKKVQQAVGRWVQRIAGKTRAETRAHRARPLQELDSRALTQVAGGDSGSTATPTKGW